MENETNYILSAGDILSCKSYKIPDYQRPYVWSEDLALGLLSSIKKSFKNGSSDEILLGHIILHVEADAINIVDGQQRITTLAIILKALGDNDVPFLDNKLNILSHKALKRNFELLKIEFAEDILLTIYNLSGRKTADNKQTEKYLDARKQLYEEALRLCKMKREK